MLSATRAEALTSTFWRRCRGCESAYASWPAPNETVLDLSGLTFIDSSGIQLLFEATREAKANG
jgi:anti-anti-sigma regulatory factor